jgi:hypothetical protein
VKRPRWHHPKIEWIALQHCHIRLKLSRTNGVLTVTSHVIPAPCEVFESGESEVS